MVDITTTQAQAEGAAPSTSHEGGQTMATLATPVSALPPLSADGVDRQYRQLADIHGITTV
jgi:hypothetical protein